jgi:hypothetical protein
MSWMPTTGEGWIKAVNRRLRNLEGKSSPTTLRPYTTAERPAANTVAVGLGIFNTTTNKPNWSDGANWRDSAGTVV